MMHKEINNVNNFDPVTAFAVYAATERAKVLKTKTLPTVTVSNAGVKKRSIILILGVLVCAFILLKSKTK
jgi:hypothetical protein